MKQAISGCRGYYLSKDGKHCEIHQKKVLTLADCKRCTCHDNQYKKIPVILQEIKQKEKLLNISDSYKVIASILEDIAYGRDTIKEALKRTSRENKEEVINALQLTGYIKPSFTLDI